MGPYMISHPKFTPSFKILSHPEEAQIPWGVVRLEFRNEKAVFSANYPCPDHTLAVAEVQAEVPYRSAEVLSLPQCGQ